MSKILEHKSSCTKSDPRSIQLCSTFSSSLIWHWCEELLAFMCCELAMSWLLLLHRTGSEDTVSSCFLFTASMPLMTLQITEILFSIHGFFSKWKAYRLLCHSLYHSFFLFWYYLFSRGRYQPSIQCSKCRHIMDLRDRVMSVSQLCSLLSILLPFPSYF